MLEVQGVTAVEFMRRCDAGEVPGFEPVAIDYDADADGELAV